jgi:hypothetical protein
MDDARERQDWREVTEMAREHWNELLDVIQGNEQYYAQYKPKNGPGLTPWFNEYQWQSLAEPYLEGLLGLGKSSEAEALMAQWSAHRGWNGAYARAADLADKAEQKDLAERWRKKFEDR